MLPLGSHVQRSLACQNHCHAGASAAPAAHTTSGSRSTSSCTYDARIVGFLQTPFADMFLIRGEKFAIYETWDILRCIFCNPAACRKACLKWRFPMCTTVQNHAYAAGSKTVQQAVTFLICSEEVAAPVPLRDTLSSGHSAWCAHCWT